MASLPQGPGSPGGPDSPLPTISIFSGGHLLTRRIAPRTVLAFAGRTAGAPEVLEQNGASSRLAWLRQVHGGRAEVVTAPGCCGAGDALVTSAEDLGLAVYTADCVPVLLAGPTQVAAIHAGWRGLCCGTIRSALAKMEDPRPTIVAWIGPAIGPCCYEVGEEVAAKVARTTSAEVWRSSDRCRPTLDLAAAARHQLEANEVEEICQLAACTRCDPGWASFRRDGKGGGSNLSVIRRQSSPGRR